MPDCTVLWLLWLQSRVDPPWQARPAASSRLASQPQNRTLEHLSTEISRLNQAIELRLNFFEFNIVQGFNILFQVEMLKTTRHPGW